VNCRPKVQACDTATSSLTQIAWTAVQQKLRGNRAPWCTWWYLQTQYWLSIMWIRFIAYNYSASEGCVDVIHVCVNRVSMIFGATHLAINGLHCLILPKWMSQSVLSTKRQITHMLPHPKNERQWSVNDSWHCIMKNPQGCAATLTHNRTIGCLSRQQWLRQHHCYVG